MKDGLHEIIADYIIGIYQSITGSIVNMTKFFVFLVLFILLIPLMGLIFVLSLMLIGYYIAIFFLTPNKTINITEEMIDDNTASEIFENI